MSLLRVRMRNVAGYWFPVVSVRLDWNGRPTTERIDALIDTGASITLVRVDVLGRDSEALSGESIPITGVGGPGARAYKHTAGLQIGPPANGIYLAGATIFVTDSPLGGWSILLGQKDLLYRLQLFHRNQQPKPEFVLRTPVSTSPPASASRWPGLS